MFFLLQYNFLTNLSNSFFSGFVHLFFIDINAYKDELFHIKEKKITLGQYQNSCKDYQSPLYEYQTSIKELQNTFEEYQNTLTEHQTSIKERQNAYKDCQTTFEEYQNTLTEHHNLSISSFREFYSASCQFWFTKKFFWTPLRTGVAPNYPKGLPNGHFGNHINDFFHPQENISCQNLQFGIPTTLFINPLNYNLCIS